MSSTTAAALSLLLGVLMAPPVAQALQALDGLEALDEEDRAALARLAREPEATRRLALEAALHPETLVEMQLLQARSSTAFRQRVEALPREDQEALWEIVRVPGLLAELAGPGAASPAALQRIASRQPEALREDVTRLGRTQRDLLVALHAIEEEADREFDALLAGLPEEAREAFEELVDHPELVTLLARHVRLSVALGEAHRADREGTRQQLAALSEELARRDAEAVAEWQRALADDPDAVADLEEAARTYAAEHGLDYDTLTRRRTETTVNVTFTSHPYPYWFGYPHWHVHSALYPWGYWRPAPVHFGFHYPPRQRSVVFFGLPSFRFVSWYGKWRSPARHRHAHVHRHHGRFALHLERHPHYRRRHAVRHAPRAVPQGKRHRRWVHEAPAQRPDAKRVLRRPARDPRDRPKWSERRRGSRIQPGLRADRAARNERAMRRPVPRLRPAVERADERRSPRAAPAQRRAAPKIERAAERRLERQRGQARAAPKIERRREQRRSQPRAVPKIEQRLERLRGQPRAAPKLERAVERQRGKPRARGGRGRGRR